MGLWSFYRAWSRKFYPSVVVDTIAPTYYAAEVLAPSFVLEGIHFSQIPSDAVGVLARDNSEPLWNRYEQADTLLYGIVVEDDGNLRAIAKQTAYHPYPCYLGAILSADRQTIYWVNNTQPLP